MTRPPSLSDPAAAGLLGLVELQRECDTADFGHADLAYSAEECLAALAHQQYRRTFRLLAWDAGRVVGRASIGMPVHDDTSRAHVHVCVHPARRRSGIGTALAEALAAVCAGNGRTVLIADSEHPVHHGDVTTDGTEVPAKSGTGSLPRDAGARFAMHNGFTLEQVERYSVLAMPAGDDALSVLENESAARAGDPAEYRLVTWTDRCPDARVDDYARLYARMSTDAPSAGIETIEETWDSRRVRDYEATAREQGRTLLISAAEHVQSGRLVAFTELALPAHVETFAFQHDTLVLAEHRGRKLGQFVKVANIRRLQAARPGVLRVHTWNAAENSFMLAVNIAMGFTTAGWCGQWQKRAELP